jgi:hypothetical protein
MKTSAHFSHSHQGRPGLNLLLMGTAATFAVVFVLLQLTRSESTAISLSLLTILISGFTGVWQFRRYGLDPLALFCFCFLLYDGLLLLRLTVLGSSATILYPTTFGAETYAAAGALCAIASIAVLLTTFLWELTIGDSSPSTVKPPLTTFSTAWFWAGFCSFTAGFVLYYLQFQQFGGYVASLAISRGERFELAADPSALSYPYMMLVVPGIACLCYGSQLSESKFQRFAFYGFTTLWCLLVILQGDRRLFLQALVTIAGVLAVIKPNLLRPKMRTWALLTCAYCFCIVLGYARNSISSVFAGNISPGQALDDISVSVSDDGFRPERSEFAGPYLSLLVAVSGSSEKLLGSSYYESFLTVLPRFLYPGEKPALVSETFAEDMAEGGGTASGWGYNPVAEAFINFDVGGVVLIFALWTIYFLCIRSVRSCGEWGVLLSAALLSEAINANRIDFRNVYWETTYLFAGLLLTATLATVLRAVYRKLPQSSAPIQIYAA